MGSFFDCLEVEADGYRLVEPFLHAVSYQGRYVIVGYNLEAQHKGWDVFLQVGPDRSLTMDLKCVRGDYPCLFLENYSNRSQGRYGWMHTGAMDLLGYLMLGSGELTVVDFPLLQAWAIDNVLENGYPHVPQARYDQLNDSWGVLVPKADLRRDLRAYYIDANINEPWTFCLPETTTVTNT